MPNTDAELSLGFNLTQAQNDIKELEKLLKDASKKIEGKGFTSLESRLEAAEKNAKGLSDELSAASTNVSAIADNLKELSAEKQATLTKIADEERGLSKLQRIWNEKYERNPESAGAKRNLSAQAEQNRLIKENREYIALIEEDEAKLQAEYEKVAASSQEVLSNYAQQKDIISQTLSDVELSVNANQELAQSTKEEADNLATVKENLDGAKDSAQSFSQSVKDISGEGKNPLNALAESSQECAGQLTSVDSVIRSITEDTNALWSKMQSNPATDNIAELIRRYNQLKEAKKTLETLGVPAGADSTYRNILRMIELINSQIQGYKQNLRGVSNEHTKVAETGKQLKSIPPLVSVIKKGFKDWHKDTTKIKRSFDSMAKSMKDNLKHLITSITKYVLGFRSLFFLVRRLRKYIGEGIKNMAQFNDGNNHVNASITRLLSSLLYLKNAWATAFSPILQFVTPWLEALIDKIAEAGNAFSRFLGSLLGQTQVFQAVKVKAADYADSLDNVGGSAGGAADKTKKLTDRLAAFDDLNVLGVDRDPDKNRGGGGGGYNDQYAPNPNDMFNLVTVADEIKRKFQEMWALADFSDLGASLAQKLKDMLENLLDKFPEIKESAHRLGESIGTFITGFFRDTSLFNDAGTAVAESLNTITEFITGFFDGYQAGKIGAAIASFFRGIFENFNWEEAGEALGSLVDGLFKELNALVSGFPTEVVAKGISDFIRSAIDTVEWSTVGELLSSALIGIFDIATVLSENLSTDELQTALEDFLSTIKWDELFTAIGKSINASANATIAISDAITSAVLSALDDPNTVFSVSKGFGSFLSNLNITEVVSGVAEFLGKVIYETSKPSFLLSLLGGFVVGLSEALADSLTATAEKSGIENWWEKPGWALVEGLAKGIDEAIINIFNAVTSPFVAIEDGFCELFGIHSPSTVAEGWGINIIEGLVNGINGLISTVMEPFNKLKEDLDGKWTEIKTSASEKWTDIKNKLAEKGTDIKNKLGEVWTNIRGDAYSAWVMLRISAVQAFTQLKDALKAPINGVLSVIESMINKIIGGINSVVSKINTIPDIKFTNPFTGTEYKLGFSIPKLSSISIPRLAQGAVIPPNREFMAVLGDQSHGTNIEAPLDTIKQAVAEVLATSGNAEMIQLLQQLIQVVERKNLTIGDKEIGKANARYVNQQRMIRGTSF